MRQGIANNALGFFHDAAWGRKIHEGHSSELIGFSKESLATLS